MISRIFRLMLRQIDVQLRVRTINLDALLTYLLQPAIFSGVGMILSKVAGNEKPDLVYMILGGGFLGMWSGLVFSSTYDIQRDRRDGTLEIIVGSPTPLYIVEAIRTFSNVCSGLFSMIAAFAVAIIIFGYSLSEIYIPGAAISVLLVIFGMWTIGILLANFFVWSRLSGSIVELLEFPVAIICGFMFPITILPNWMQVCSTILPIRWAIQAFDAALMGESRITSFLFPWAMTVLLSLIYWGLARWLDNKVNIRIRVTGEMSSI